MAIFICIFRKLNRGMDAGDRKGRKGYFVNLKTSMPFCFLSEALRGQSGRIEIQERNGKG